jgi:CDP-diacylglycerol--glycerol-3-phosphate 3-phosphatidyltransferase
VTGFATARDYAGPDMLSNLRPGINRIFAPIARALIRLHVTPDAVTVAGTAGVAVGALVFYPRGSLFGGTVFISCFVFADSLDGVLARMIGTSRSWGAFLDSTLDRVGDGAIFGGLVWWYLRAGDQPWLGGLALACLIGGSVISYAKARAESLGMTCNTGVAERPERLVAVLASTGLSGLGVPFIASVGLWLLTVLTAVTIAQRLAVVHRQAVAPAETEAPLEVRG